MKRSGFTLIELLVVIAIISILAAIAVPNIAKYLERARMVKAAAEISNIDLALTKMLTDAGKKDFAQFFEGQMTEFYYKDENNKNLCDTASEFQIALQTYQEIFYRLLRQGRGASDLNGTTKIKISDSKDIVLPKLKQDVVARLGDTYLEIKQDPWGEKYNFYPGPYWGYLNRMVFRSYIAPEEDGAGDLTVFVYDTNAKAKMDEKLPGNPRPEDVATKVDPNPKPLPGFPAPRDLTMYIFSAGQNLTIDQPIDEALGNEQHEDLYRGGGDDINNWDKEGGWSGFYSR